MLTSVIVFLRYVLIRFKFEEVRSFDALETGRVARVWNSLNTLG